MPVFQLHAVGLPCVACLILLVSSARLAVDFGVLVLRAIHVTHFDLVGRRIVGFAYGFGCVKREMVVD